MMFYAYDYQSPIHSTCSTPSSNLHDIPITNDTLPGKNKRIFPLNNIVNISKHGSLSLIFTCKNPDVPIYPLVNFHIAMENHHAINGSIHYFYGHVP